LRRPSLDEVFLAITGHATEVNELDIDANGTEVDTRIVVRSIVWMIVIVAVFAPLAIARYRRRV
jgi:hypothetical protein